jgi:hypothetical protein
MRCTKRGTETGKKLASGSPLPVSTHDMIRGGRCTDVVPASIGTVNHLVEAGIAGCGIPEQDVGRPVAIVIADPDD